MASFTNMAPADPLNLDSSEDKQDDGRRLENADLDLKYVPRLTPKQERKLWRKVDMRLIPILSLMYLLAFIDRSNIGNAKLEGLTTQLNLTGDRFNIALTMFIIPYCVCEPASNLALRAFRPSRWLPAINLVWGIVMVIMSFVKNYPQLLGARICLGVAEAGLFPGAFSGLLAFGISNMNGIGGLEAWSWIFLLEGLATIVVSFFAFFWLVDLPDSAAFLTPEERAFVIWKKKYDVTSVGEEETFAVRHIWAAFKDWQVWFHTLIYTSIVVPLTGITLFLPTIINSFGYSASVSQLLTIPPYVCATIVVFVFAHYSDKLKMRSPFIFAGHLMCLIGLSINISTAPIGVKYFGTFWIVIGGYAAIPGIVSWFGNNIAGQYKRAVSMALQIGIGNSSGVVAAMIYRTQDSPRFILGHGVSLVFIGIGLIFIPIVVLLYKRINAQRDAIQRLSRERAEKVQYSDQELREMGDRAPDFRYTL
ncbi:MFS general substrate transporter [Rhizopogon vinicolor AM-OR11-026]|uniref:MFS general substrate transporter n=1 Tax=Rhizopogon vinicolor AM-OR11-026 TaxID=1314800 RepID=A0A1B7MF70_9AGAM|nr:MFS general substrate transporter [Rhizopogon vinicolor AM-OR11-026]